MSEAIAGSREPARRRPRTWRGTVVRNLGHEVRLTQGPREVACIKVYQDEQEWAVLSARPTPTLRETRHLTSWDRRRVAIDALEHGAFVAVVYDGDDHSERLPSWLDVVREVAGEESWTARSRGDRKGHRGVAVRRFPVGRRNLTDHDSPDLTPHLAGPYRHRRQPGWEARTP